MNLTEAESNEFNRCLCLFSSFYMLKHITFKGMIAPVNRDLSGIIGRIFSTLIYQRYKRNIKSTECFIEAPGSKWFCLSFLNSREKYYFDGMKRLNVHLNYFLYVRPMEIKIERLTTN